MTRVAIFVDTQNVYYTVREAYGKHFDYRWFWARATANADVVVLASGDGDFELLLG